MIAIVVIKYKPVYKVSISGEIVGYIQDKEEFNKSIEEMLNEKETENVAFITIDQMPEYELKLVSDVEQTNESQILNQIKSSAITTYSTYAITLNGQNKAYVGTMEEADNVVNQIKKEFDGKLELNIGIEKIYTEDLASLGETQAENAKTNLNNELKSQIKIKQSTVNGVVLASKPVTGVISSRYGDTEDRGKGHGGLDIAAPSGTPIYACGVGTVIQAGWNNGGYGNLVIIDHGSGIKTYYAHCSKVFVSKGQKVSSGEKIAAVGSTGDSTGPHLHLEVRINGSRVNPQKYLYK